MKLKRNQINGVGAEAEEELIVLKSLENETVVPARKNHESAVKVKNVPINMTTVIRTTQTNTNVG